MAKPTYQERFTTSGDTIPASLPAGPGGGGNRAYYDTGTAAGQGGVYNTGTKMCGYLEDAHPSVINRSTWQLSSNTDSLYEHEIAELTSTGDLVGTNVNYYLLTNSIYLGEEGFGASDLGTFMDVTDENGNPLRVSAARVNITGVYMDAGLTKQCFPSALGKLLAINTTPAIIAGVSGTALTLDAPGLTAAYTGANGTYGASLFNYSKWLRLVRDGGSANFYKCFATISNKTSDTVYTMHVDVETTYDWDIDDEIFTTYFTSTAYVKFSVAIPTSTHYMIFHGKHGTLGLMNRLSLIGLQLATRMAPTSLDDAYDGGREITIDSGPIEMGGTPSLGTVMRIETVGDAVRAELGIDIADNYPDTNNLPAMYGLMIRKRIGFDVSDTDFQNTGEACTGTVGGVITLTRSGAQFSSGTPAFTSSFAAPGDVAWITSSGSPVGTGMFLLYSFGSAITDATFKEMDGTTADLSTADTIHMYRPLITVPVSAGEGGAYFRNTGQNNGSAATFVGMPGPQYGFVCKHPKYNDILFGFSPALSGEGTGPRLTFGNSAEGSENHVFYLENYYDNTNSVTKMALTAVKSATDPMFSNIIAGFSDPASLVCSVIGPRGDGNGILSGGNTTPTALVLGGIAPTSGAMANNSSKFAVQGTSGNLVSGIQAKRNNGQFIECWLEETPTTADLGTAKRFTINNSDGSIEYGWQSWASKTKLVPLATAMAESGSDWSYNLASGTRGDVWTHTVSAGGDDRIVIPIPTPHNIKITKIDLKYYVDSNASSFRVSIFLRSWTDFNLVEGNDEELAYETVSPGSSGEYTQTVPSGSPIAKIVDSATETIVVVVNRKDSSTDTLELRGLLVYYEELILKSL